MKVGWRRQGSQSEQEQHVLAELNSDPRTEAVTLDFKIFLAKDGFSLRPITLISPRNSLWMGSVPN